MTTIGDQREMFASPLGALSSPPPPNDFFDKNPSLVTVTGLDGRVLLANRTWSELLGHPNELVLGRSITSFIHPEHVAAFTAALKESTVDGASRNIDVPLRASSGTYVWFFWQFRPDSDGRNLFSTACDISERKQQELAYQRRAYVTSLRAEIWSALCAGQSSQSVFNAWTALLKRSLEAAEIGIWTHNEKLGAPELRTAPNDKPALGDARLVLELLTDEVREVFRTRTPRSFADRGDAPASIPLGAIIRERRVKTILLHPVLLNDRVIAVAAACFGRVGSEVDAFLLEKACSEMGVALGLVSNQDRFYAAKRAHDVLLRTAPVAVCSLDTAFHVTAWNTAAERLFGWPAADVIGRPLPFVCHEEREIYRACLEGALAGRSTAHYESKGLTRTGELVEIGGSVSPLFTADGSVEGILLALADFSERKRAERRLALQQSVTRILDDADSVEQVMGALLPILGTHLAASCAEFWRVEEPAGLPRRVASWNAPAANAAKFENETRGWIPAEPVDLANRILAAGTPLRLEKISADRNIDRGTLAARCGLDALFGVPIKSGNEHAGVLLFFADSISQPDAPLLNAFAAVAEQLGQFLYRQRLQDSLNHAEENLRQSEKMDSIGRLVGGVAHDFNNLLTVILGYGDVVLEQVASDAPIRDLLLEIVDAGKRASGLTRQLLAFCRKEIYNPVVLDLNAHVEGMEKMFRRLIGEAIELQTSLEPKLAHVNADPAQIEQVLMNLVVNARDSMPDGGGITIETQAIELGRDQTVFPQARPGSYVLLAVCDTGCGMNEATRVRVFEPFFTTKGVGKGTGMGLATVQGIVEQCGGHIGVESQPGAGTTFKILFPPVVGGLSAWEVDSAPQPIPHGTETILVAEDETHVRRLIGRLLRIQKYNVLEAANAAEALELIKSRGSSIHLLLTDVVMPDQNGPELAKQVQSRHPQTKVLFVSGYRDSELARMGLPDLGSRLLQKPFTTFDLATKVREVLDA